jgi:hypothetical protein
MSFNLNNIRSGQSNICEVLITPQFSDCIGSIGLKVFPKEDQFVMVHLEYICVNKKQTIEMICIKYKSKNITKEQKKIYIYYYKHYK